MSDDIHEGWFRNKDTGQEMNVQYDEQRVFITHYKEGKAVAKYVFDVTKSSPSEIVDFIRKFNAEN